MFAIGGSARSRARHLLNHSSVHHLVENGLHLIVLGDVSYLSRPTVVDTGRFLLQSMMAVAELEAGMISARTKAALAASKARGKRLGGFRGRAGTAEDTARARAARTIKATQQARSIAPIIDRVDPDRTASLRGIARALNDEGVPTPSGEGTWAAATVARLRQRRTVLNIRGM
jgi:DNA invertase Pin-like site-specific DNA recombinase